jgi:hypothetical protein
MQKPPDGKIVAQLPNASRLPHGEAGLSPQILPLIHPVTQKIVTEITVLL